MQANRKAFENTQLQSLLILHVATKGGDSDFEFSCDKPACFTNRDYIFSQNLVSGYGSQNKEK